VVTTKDMVFEVVDVRGEGVDLTVTENR